MVVPVPLAGPFVSSSIEAVKKHVGFVVYSKKKVRQKDQKMQQLNDKRQDVLDQQERAILNTELLPELVEPWQREVEELDEKCQSIKPSGWLNPVKRYKAGKRSHEILRDIQHLDERSSNIVFSHKQKALADVGPSTRPSLYTRATPGIQLRSQPSTSTSIPRKAQNKLLPSISGIQKNKSQQSTSTSTHVGTQKDNSRPSMFAPIPRVVQNNLQPSSFSGTQEDRSQPSTSASLPRDDQNSLLSAISSAQKNESQPSTFASPPVHAQDNFRSSTFKSRDLVFNAALQSLRSNVQSQNMIALCGMGGVGKTMMMEDLKKAVEDLRLFDHVVKVVLSENTDTKALQIAIAEGIKMEIVEVNKSAIAERFGVKFKKMSQIGKKKMLVIMDDLWKKVELKDVGLSPLPNGFKILFTSRFEDACKQMGVEANSIFNVPTLDDAEAQTLFFRTVGECDDLEIQKIGADIVKKCGGLPEAIVWIANSLRGREIETWEELLIALENDDLKDVLDVHKLLEESYNNLKREDDKALFLLSGLFPHDCDIPVDDLTMYGWGLKLFRGDVASLADARRRSKTCVDNLQHANMLTRSDIRGCIKMHGLIRAFVLSNFSSIKQASFVNSDNMSQRQLTKYNQPYERVLCTSSASGFPEYFHYPDLLLLILEDAGRLRNFPPSFHETMTKLQVVSYKQLGHPLPLGMFQCLPKLRTLSLHTCQIRGDISAIECCVNLEALSFVTCNVRRLPSNIGKLGRLKLLEVSGCDELSIDDDVLDNLKKLEELYIRPSKGRRIGFTDANLKGLEKLSKKLSALELEFHDNTPEPEKVTFEKLERFRLSIGCELEDSERCSFRNTLYLSTKREKILECKVGHLFKKTEELKLHEVNNIEGLEKVLTGDQAFSGVRILYVSQCQRLEYLFTVGVAGGMRRLEQLTVSDCPSLRTLVGGNRGNETTAFKKLSFLSLEGLPSMVSLCDTGLELPEVLEMRLDGLPNITSIYGKNSSDAPSLLNQKVVIPKLQKLGICRMEKLQDIWPVGITLEESNVSMLREIRVKECRRLVNLFPCNPWPLLSHLEEIEIESCGCIEELFNIDYNCLSLEEGCIVSSLRTIRVKDLPNLTVLWCTIGENSRGIRINAFSSEGEGSIRIRECGRYEREVTPTATHFHIKAGFR